MTIKHLKIKGTEDLAVIDAEDYERVKYFDWQVVSNRKDGKYPYVRCWIGKAGKQKYIRLAHMILGYAESDEKIRVTYVNKNSFDLRKSNLWVPNRGDNKNLASAIPTIRISFDKSCNDKRKRSPFSIRIYLREIKEDFVIGHYPSEQNAKNVIRYIEENNIPISNEEEIDLAKPIIRAWAVENGFANPSLSNIKKNTYKIGDERITKGYVDIKTDKGWMSKHHFLWKQAGNVIPENHCLFFKDGNNRNFDLENLEVVSLKDKTRQIHLHKYPEELRPTVELIWQLKHAIKDEKNKQSKNNSNGSEFSI